jgi:hypothetical protein
MAYISTAARPISLGDRYLLLLSGVLLGYAVIGKGFAYLGIPPLFIGEIALLTGFFVFLRSGCAIAALASPPSLLLAAAMVWVLLRTLPFVGTYGFEALRDSVVVMYGGFAFIIVALVIEDTSRINTLVRYYGVFLSIYLPSIPVTLALSRYMWDYIPQWPVYNVALLFVQPTEVAVHLAGAAVFVLVGFRRPPLLVVVPVLATLAMVITTSRGGMLAIVVPVVLATLVLGKVRQLAVGLAVALALLVAAPALETGSDSGQEGAGVKRQLSSKQLVANVESITGYSEEKLEGTKTWRLEWWDVIMKHTVFGPNFWGGRGFGLNLADADGFQDRADPNSPPLRSPHNVHMTILARAGVPGAALWLLFLVFWSGMIGNALLVARRRREAEWVGLFVWIGCYAASAVINGSFDVALEGPVQGVWFWCLIGFGMGAAMIYRCQTSSPSRHLVVAGDLRS